MLGSSYADPTVLSIAADGRDMSFSSDTGMAECLVVARKRKVNDPVGEREHITSLKQRPTGFAASGAIAKNLLENDYTRQIEDGPYGGTRLTIGDELAGEMLTAPGGADGESWGSVRLLDYSLAQTAYALAGSKLWLPGNPEAATLKVAALGAVGRLGLVHRDITGPPPRGPFTLIASSLTATYPALWNHDAKKETPIVCDPDSQLEVRPWMETKAAAVWATASRAHLSTEYTFGSQPLAVAVTERESVGGRVWPNVIFDDTRLDYAFSVWGNSTLGLLSYWWHSSRQQSSKASMTIRQAETLPVLDFRALSDARLATAEVIFNEFRELDLLPAYLADADPNRDLLGFDEEVYRGVRRLAAKWCAEPSVHGGKVRPKTARLVV